MSTSEARLMIAASETDADMYYATRFLAPDPFIFFQIGEEKHLLMSDLERDRARECLAQVDRVLSLSEYQEKAKKNDTDEEPSQIDALHEFLQEKNITHLNVPRAFAVATADDLRERGYASGISRRRVLARAGNQNPRRNRTHPRSPTTHCEAAMDAAITLIRNSEIRGNTPLPQWRTPHIGTRQTRNKISPPRTRLHSRSHHRRRWRPGLRPPQRRQRPTTRTSVHHHRHLPPLKHHRLLRRPHPHRRQRRTLCRPPEHLRRGLRRTKPRPRQRTRRSRRPLCHPPITHRTI